MRKLIIAIVVFFAVLQAVVSFVASASQTVSASHARTSEALDSI